ncbi:hypothetical protein, partial [Bacillus cereus]|uniref:hypothetical protein n=1 Tax=Bacillus cereus TaxID=1396 RepID=UPI0014822689
NNTNAQKWKIEQVDAPIIPNGIYNISTKLNYKKLIDHEESSNEAMIYQYMNLPTSEWKFEYDSGKRAYKIRSTRYQNLGLYFQGKNLSISVNNVDAQNDSRAYWTIEYDDQKGGYAIRSAFDPDQLLNLKDSNLNNRNLIITYRPNFNKNQLWNLAPVKE